MENGGAVSILILAHNKADVTRRGLRSLVHSTLRPLQIVLVDNGSTDETPEVLADFKKKSADCQLDVHLVRHSQNLGAIVGRNSGWPLLTGEFHVFLDNDVFIRSRSWLERLRRVLTSDVRVGVVGPKLLYPTPPHLIQCAGCEVTGGGRVIFRGRGQPHDAPEFCEASDCPALISACWMMRGSFARELGLLDERFSPVQFEDTDYCYRVREAGFLCRYVPDVEMYHCENVTSGRTATLNYSYLTVKNGLKFKEKWRAKIAAEGGPPDSAWRWADLPATALSRLPDELPLLP
jgi:GT2 family glycosyltransferase